MPTNVTESPWKPTRDRQDFSEELYIKITLSDCPADVIDSIPQSPSFYRITVNTTAGYFELPNYMNGGVAGPLLDQDPIYKCGIDCFTEGTDDAI